MRLPGTIEERLRVLRADRASLLAAGDTTVIQDEEVRVACKLAEGAFCIRLRLVPEDIQLFQGGRCADFALLVSRGGDAFEAHVCELTRTVSRQKWDTVREQLEWAVVRLLAIAGVLGVELEGVVVYTAFHQDKLSREAAQDPALLKLPVDPTAAENARRWADARRSLERRHIRMEALGRDVEHRRIPGSNAAPATVECRRREPAADTHWIFEAAG